MGASTRAARGRRGVPAHDRALRALRVTHRTADLLAVVVSHGRARTAGYRGAGGAARPLSPRVPAPIRDLLAGDCTGLEHLRADLVGTPPAGVVLRRRSHHGRRDRTCRVLRV